MFYVFDIWCSQVSRGEWSTITRCLLKSQTRGMMRMISYTYWKYQYVSRESMRGAVGANPGHVVDIVIALDLVPDGDRKLALRLP